MKKCLKMIQSSTSDEIWNPPRVRTAANRYGKTDILSDSDTRRQAATEFTRALMENFEIEVTDIIKGYIAAFLQVGLRTSTGLTS